MTYILHIVVSQNDSKVYVLNLKSQFHAWPYLLRLKIFYQVYYEGKPLFVCMAAFRNTKILTLHFSVYRKSV